MKQGKTESKQVIFTDLEAYNLELKNQEAKLKIFKNILKEIEEVIDLDKIDFQLLEEQRLTYIIDLFHNLNENTLPKYITPAKALQLTNFDSAAVYRLFQQYDGITNYKALKIEKNAINISVVQEDYDWYLNNEKSEHYKLVVQLLDNLKKLEAFGKVRYENTLNLVNGLRLRGKTPYIDYSYFKA